MIIVPKSRNSKIKFYDGLGRMPEKTAMKRYMHVYHLHSDYEVVDDGSQQMGGWFKSIKKAVSKAFRSLGKFVSQVAKEVAKIAEPALKVVKGVGSFTEDVYSAAKNVALSVLPPDIRNFVSDGILTLENVVTKPGPTISKITQTAGEIAHNIVKETSNAVEYTYKNVARPAFRIARNVVNEVVWRPINVVVDVTVMPILPASIREKLEEVMDIPDKTFQGKLTDKEILEGMKAYGQIALIPYKEVGKFDNAVINTLKKDAILGPFIMTLDKYSGGLITSGQNLMALPDDIYHDRQIDWKSRIIDGLKIYLTVVSAGTISAAISNIAKGMAVNYIGDETGLNGTVLGRTALSAGVLYASSLNYGSMEKFAESATTDLAKDVSKQAAIREAKSETVKEAVKQGWVDSAFTAKLIMSAGTTLSQVPGSDKTLMDAMSDIHDKEFQNYVDYLVKKETGLPITYAHLADLYNTDWAKIAQQVANAMSKISIVPGSSDTNFLANMGQNFLDEMRRAPGNFANIGSNVLDEIGRSPENLAKLAKAIASETARTPENIAQIATNIARESARGASNVVDEAVRTQDNAAEVATNVGRETVRAVDNVADEIQRTPENVSEIADNVVRETGQAVENVLDEAGRTPGNIADAVAKTNWDDLIQKFGPSLIPFLYDRYPGYYPDFPPTDGMIDQINLNFGQKKGAGAGVLVGLAAVIAGLAYVATDD